MLTRIKKLKDKNTDDIFEPINEEIKTCLQISHHNKNCMIWKLLEIYIKGDKYLNLTTCKLEANIGTNKPQSIGPTLLYCEKRYSYIINLYESNQIRKVSRLGLINLAYYNKNYNYKYALEFYNLFKKIENEENKKIIENLKSSKDIFSLYNLFKVNKNFRVISKEDYIIWCLANYIFYVYKFKYKQSYEDILDPFIFINCDKNKYKKLKYFLLNKIIDPNKLDSEESIWETERSNFNNRKEIEEIEDKEIVEEENYNLLTVELLKSRDFYINNNNNNNNKIRNYISILEKLIDYLKDLEEINNIEVNIKIDIKLNNDNDNYNKLDINSIDYKLLEDNKIEDIFI